MITRKHNVVSTAARWPYTPEPSPPLGPTIIQTPIDHDFNMPDEGARLRPMSMMLSRRDGVSPSGRPTLHDVLNNRAPSPFTLAAYTAFLSQQHCLETLEFVTEAKKYAVKYDEAAAAFAGMPLTTDSDQGFELGQDWSRLLDVYVKPGAPREINLPAEDRDDLIDVPYELKPPRPEALDNAIQRMYDLMSDSIFIPFCNSMMAASPAPLSTDSPHMMTTIDHGEKHSRRRTSPPTTSPTMARPPASSLSSGPERHNSPRLSMHISHSSAASDTAMSDQSSTHSPVAGERDMVSPPLTPPRSDMTLFHGGSTRGAQPRPQRNDSGGWKKLGNKLFGSKKSR